VERHPSTDVGTDTPTTADDKCEYIGTTEHFSKFSVGGLKRPNSSGGGGPEYVIVDSRSPSIVSYYWKPDSVYSGNGVTINANILDDVSVRSAHMFYYGPGEESRNAHMVSMNKLNGQWFAASIPGTEVKSPNMSFWIVALDAAGNSAKTSETTINVKQGQSAPQTKPSQKNLPAHVLEAIKPKSIEPVEKLEVISINGGKSIVTFPDQIVIKNTGNRTVDNIRVMLSPEISKSFKLSNPSVKSIEPNANVTITVELNGSPNRDMLGNLVGYNGRLIVMAEHHSPITLPVNIGGQESSYLASYMDKVASKAEQRYNKLSLLNSILSKQPKTEHNYEVTTSGGSNEITSPSDQLVIRNFSDKELKNVRIYLSNAGHALLLEQNNILALEPNGQVSIKLIPRIDSEKYSPRDIKGELLIVPSNDNPIKIPINIATGERKDSANEFEVTTVSGNNTITKAVDTITIKNTADRTMHSVKVMLNSNLARLFSLNETSFQNIKSGEEVQIRYEARDMKTLMQNFNGELTIVSEHHNMKIMPINIEWKERSSQHFSVYSRSGNEAVAEQVIDLLEFNYQNITSRFSEMKGKTVIYITSNIDEMKLVSPSGHPYYSYTDDTIFVCACDDVQGDALKQFIYRLAINNYPSYHNMKKLTFDQENWLLDGISSYVAADTLGVEEHVALADSKVSFQWHGYGSDAQYGATYSFFEFLDEKYGNNVIDRTLGYLGSGMVSNHKCSAVEDCAVLLAVYDVTGLDIDNKRNTLTFSDLIEQWEEYIKRDQSNPE
jgi:hypothetical protein